jgi:hypothetical protein
MNLVANKKDRGILLVDDDKLVVQALQTLLDAMGYTNVLSANSGAEVDRLHSLVSRAPGRQLRRTINGGIQTVDLNPISV